MTTPDYEIKYNGCYPNSCSGTLTIIVRGKVEYRKDCCCTSSGSVWFDSDWDEHVEDGRLTWDDEEATRLSWPGRNTGIPFNIIAEAVQETLDGVGVCCGGCV